MRKIVIHSSLSSRWDTHHAAWANCHRCPIGQTCANHVLGKGKLPAKVLFVGEAPGPSEDILGYPFVGRSGKLLDQMILESQQRLRPYSYFVTNTLACYPVADDGEGFRAPHSEELENCRSRVEDVLQMCEPRALVYVGKVAASLDKVWMGIPAIRDLLLPDERLVIYHPSYLLRRGGAHSLEYKKTLNDLCKFIGKVLHVKA